MKQVIELSGDMICVISYRTEKNIPAELEKAYNTNVSRQWTLMAEIERMTKEGHTDTAAAAGDALAAVVAEIERNEHTLVTSRAIITSIDIIRISGNIHDISARTSLTHYEWQEVQAAINLLIKRAAETKVPMIATEEQPF